MATERRRFSTRTPPSFISRSINRHFILGRATRRIKGWAKASEQRSTCHSRPGCGDADYRKAFEERLKPAAEAFRPDFVLISAGFDAANGDLLGGMKVTPEGYAELTRIVKGIAEMSW